MDVDRFPNYRELTARRADARASCGHPVTIGDRIGWNPKNKRTQCARCWSRWTAENAAADADERMSGGAW
jgi:hypothetical protein